MHDRPRVPILSLTRIVQSTGRGLDLAELLLVPTYGDLSHGYPCRPANDQRIQALLHTAARLSPAVPVHLIPPPRAYPDQYPGAFGPVETLPPVACVGRFSSTPLTPANDLVTHRSGLTVIWFQPTPRIPDPYDADPTLRDIDWPTLARDYALGDLPYGP
nr:hypothetical protein [Streptomyces violaceorubidus]